MRMDPQLLGDKEDLVEKRLLWMGMAVMQSLQLRLGRLDLPGRKFSKKENGSPSSQHLPRRTSRPITYI